MRHLSLNRNQLKYLVIVAMLIDHIAWKFVSMSSVLGQVMHFIGRLTGPTMAFFIAEGYIHTRDVKKYAKRLGIFALISFIPYCFFECGSLPLIISHGDLRGKIFGISFYLTNQNNTVTIVPLFGVIFTLFLSLLAVWLWDKGRCPKWCKVLAIIGLCLLSMFGDWQIFDILYALFFFCYHDEPKKKWLAYSLTSIIMVFPLNGDLWSSLFQIGVYMVPFLIQFCYNGEGGSKKPIHKWFFYLFYPAHLLILGLLKYCIL